MRHVDKSESRVGTVILHYNRPELVDMCLESLRSQKHPLETLILVDNGSHDEVSVEDPQLPMESQVIRLEENRGFAGGVNVGIRWLQDHTDSDYIWLLNNDTQCEPDVLEDLVRMLDADPKLAAVSCKLEEPHLDETRTFIAGGFFPFPMLIPFISKPGDRVDYLCGACLLIRKEALEEVGLFDDQYFFFFEDADWSIRARRAGWKLGVTEDVLVHHQRSSTIGSMERLRSSYYRRSYIRFLNKYSSAPRMVAVLTTCYRLLSDFLHFRWESFAGTCEGWRRGWADDDYA